MSYGHESGYEAVYLELQQNNNHAIERMADAIEDMADALRNLGTQKREDPDAIWPSYDH